MRRALLVILALLLVGAIVSIFRPAARPRCVCTEEGMRPGWDCRASPAEVRDCERERGLYRLLGIVLA